MWTSLSINLFFISICGIFCQDVVFPHDEEDTHLSGNVPVTERIPVYVPERCPENMLLYPGDSSNSTWICDCRRKYLYFPLNNTCHQAYTQGPCPDKYYVTLPKGESVPQCTKNPCPKMGEVMYNGTCYPLRTAGGPCGPDGALDINETTFQVECISTITDPFMIINAPKRDCPVGSRRNELGMCRKTI